MKKSAEEYVKEHFPGIEKGAMFPVIVAIDENYAIYTSLHENKKGLAKIEAPQVEFKPFYY